MKSLETEGWLPDVNVWVALCSDRHEHHKAAASWLETVDGPVYFCRVTQMSLLRLLTNRNVMGSDVLSPVRAIATYSALLADYRVKFAAEPAEIEEYWLQLMRLPEASGSAWTDAWLAAFAISVKAKLVSFDAGMRRWKVLQPQVLSAESTG